MAIVERLQARACWRARDGLAQQSKIDQKRVAEGYRTRAGLVVSTCLPLDHHWITTREEDSARYVWEKMHGDSFKHSAKHNGRHNLGQQHKVESDAVTLVTCPDGREKSPPLCLFLGTLGGGSADLASPCC